MGYGERKSERECEECTIDGCDYCTLWYDHESCDVCQDGMVKSGNWWDGYTCTNDCDLSSDDYCIHDGICYENPDYAYKTPDGSCEYCPSLCDKCEWDTTISDVVCTSCHEHFCINHDIERCTFPCYTDYFVMPYLNDHNEYDYICEDGCQDGYKPDKFDYCHKCDPEDYPICGDENCIEFKFKHGKPKCKKCIDGYTYDKHDTKMCVSDFSCLIGTIEIDET